VDKTNIYPNYIALTKVSITLSYTFLYKGSTQNPTSPNILDSILSENTEDRPKQPLALAYILHLY